MCVINAVDETSVERLYFYFYFQKLTTGEEHRCREGLAELPHLGFCQLHVSSLFSCLEGELAAL